MKRVSLLVVLMLLGVVTTTRAQNYDEIVKESVKYLEEIKERWEIPGLSFALVKDGEMIYASGFGVKEMGKEERVDSKTVFQIGSISKSFTAAVMASLVAEGKVKWEDTVKNILPDFQLYDKWIEENLQVKDVMTHRTGLQGQLGTYIPNMGYGRDDVYKMLPLLKPIYSFRGRYAYNNITFIIASQIIEKLTGKSWDENVKERVFEPLGMNDSWTTGEEFESAPNVVTPHSFYYTKGRELEGGKWVDSVAVAPQYDDERGLHWLTVIGPAGSISSTAEDMAKYLLFHLNRGVVDGKEVIPAKEMDYLRVGHTITSQDSARVTMYSHCWFVETNTRYRLYFHTGTTWGSTAITAFVPELNMGMVMLNNSEAPSWPRYALMRRIIDLFKGYPEQDYNKEYWDNWIKTSREGVEKRDKERAEMVEVAAPDNSLIVGRYNKDKLFGSILIEEEDGQLYITAGPLRWKKELRHHNGNSYRFRMGGHTYPLNFHFNEATGKCKGLEIDFAYTENFGLWYKE